MTPTPDRPDVLHNMSVPPTSRLTVRRASHPGRRFRIDLAARLSRTHDDALRQSLGRHGWERAWTLLARAGDGPVRPRRRTRALLVEHLEAALRRASVPDRVGVFLDEEPDAGPARTLGPAATLAVLARRSGPLYLPDRALDPSLVDPQRLVLFFPEVRR